MRCLEDLRYGKIDSLRFGRNTEPFRPVPAARLSNGSDKNGTAGFVGLGAFDHDWRYNLGQRPDYFGRRYGGLWYL